MRRFLYRFSLLCASTRVGDALLDNVGVEISALAVPLAQPYLHHVDLPELHIHQVIAQVYQFIVLRLLDAVASAMTAGDLKERAEGLIGEPARDN